MPELPKDRLIAVALITAVVALALEGALIVADGDGASSGRESPPRQSEAMWRLLSRDR